MINRMFQCIIYKIQNRKRHIFCSNCQSHILKMKLPYKFPYFCSDDCCKAYYDKKYQIPKGWYQDVKQD